MKKPNVVLATMTLIAILMANIAQGQENTGLAGDNFSLDGAIELFQKAQDLPHFEKLLNASDNKVNNLDLNEDGNIDYVQVIDHLENDAHAIVLQVALSPSDKQDIAVIEIEKTGNNTAILQIIGEEDIYGQPTIVEPFREEGIGGHGGPDANYDLIRVTVNVWLWSPVRAIYAPRYVRYVSPWRWGYYPNWWKPRRPLTWLVWRPVRYHYPSRYRVTTTHRVVRAHSVYTPVRSRSVVIQSRTTKVLTANGNRKVVRNYKNNKVVATNNNKKLVVNRSTQKMAVSNGNKKIYANKKSGQVVASKGGKTQVLNKPAGKKKVKRTVKRTRSKKKGR